MIRLFLPFAGIILFLVCSWATVRFLRPRDPKRYFVLYAAALAVALVAVYVARWPLVRLEDALGLAACLLLQTLACLTFWNAFYSLLWGFSGSLMHDLINDVTLRDAERLIRSYEGDGEIDRLLARRLPNLVGGGWVTFDPPTLRLRPKGRLIAAGTVAAFKFFSLGMGGGIK